MTDIAHGDIKIDLNQEEAMAGLSAIEGRFDATMSHISHAKAHAEIGVGTDKFDATIDRAKARLAEVDRAEARAELKAKADQVDAAITRVKARLKELNLAKSESVVKANKDQFDREIESANLALDRLNARKAKVTVEVKEGTRALDEADRLAKYAERRNSILRDTQKVVDSMAASEAKQAYNDAQRELRVINLKKHYADLTDEAEKLAKVQPYGREATVRLKLADDKVRAEMLKDKEELQLLGDVPPVHVKVDTDGSFLDKAKISLLDFVHKVQSGLDGLGSTHINLGPISASLKGLILAGAALAPILTSLGGGIVALAGSITTSLAGAASVGGGLLLGLVSNFIGVAAAVKPAIAGFEAARTATKSYSEAVEKHGSGSKQAIKAQEEMNSVLKSVPASSRDAAIGLSVLDQKWHSLTGQSAARDFGNVITSVTHTMGALLPGLARNTDSTMGILSGHIDSILAHLRQPAEVHAFDRLGADANKFLSPALSGIERFGAGLLHVGESAAHIFAGPAGDYIKRLGTEFDAATQPGAKLDGTMRRLGNDAADLVHFFGAFGRLAITVLNGASAAGDHLTNSMTNALNRYNAFLSSSRGKADMASFFNRSIDDVKALAGAFGPLIGAFVQWSNLLAPFTSGILKGVSFVSRLVAGLTKVVGLGGPMATLGATIGAAFAVSKIGSFVSMLYRAVLLTKELGAVGTIGKVLSGGFGNLLKQSNFAPSGVTMGESAAATLEGAAPGIGETIGAAAAAAMDTGGIVGAAERGGTGLLGPTGKAISSDAVDVAEGAGPAAVAAGTGTLATEAGAATLATEGLSGAIGGLSIASAPETLGLSLFAGGVALVALHLLTAKSSTDKWGESLRGANANARALQSGYGRFVSSLAEGQGKVDQNSREVHGLKKELDDLRSGTHQAEAVEQRYNEARRTGQRLRAEEQRGYAADRTRNSNEVSERQTAVSSLEKLSAAKRKEVEETNRRYRGSEQAKNLEKELLQLTRQQTKETEQLGQALNKRAAASANIARIEAGLPPLTKPAEQALGSLTRAGGGNVSKTIATRYANPENVTSVAGGASAALRGGVSQSIIIKVIADTHNAQQALSAINDFRVATKELNADDKISPKVLHALAAILHIPASKVTQLIANDLASAKARAARAAISAVHGTAVKILASVDGLNAVSELVGAIGRVQNKHVTVSVGTSGSASPTSFTGQLRARGGSFSPPEKNIGGHYNSPTLLVGEENRSEYVIATNPAYRESNIEYLKEAANALGVDMAAKGKKGTPADPKVAHLGSTANYEASAVPLGPVQNIVTALSKVVASEHTKLTSLKLSEAKAKEVLIAAQHTESRAKPGNSKQTAAEHTKKAEKALHGYESGVHAIEHGGSYQGVYYQRSLKNLEDERNKAKADLVKLEEANAKIAHYNSVIQTDQSKLSNLATIYNGHGPNAGSPAIKAQWEAVLADRKANIANAGAWLSSSKNVIAGLIAKHSTPELVALQDTREGEEAQNEASATESNESELTGTSSAPSAEQYAETYAANQLPALLNAFAIAQTNNVPDLPGTPQNEEIEHLGDDLTAAKGLQSFWEGLLSTAQAQHAPIETITDIANSVTSARSTEQGLAHQIEEGTKAAVSQAFQESAAFSTARLELYKNYGSNFAPIQTQLVSPTATAAQSSPSTTTSVHVTNNFSHPPADPHTWSNSLAWELGAAI